MAEKRTTALVNILIVVALIGAGALSYFYFVRNTDEKEIVEAPAGEGIETVTLTTSYLTSIIGRLENISLERTLFDSSPFQSLKNITVPVNSEPKGTPNPFGRQPF